MRLRSLGLLVFGILPVIACQSAADDDARRIRQDVRLVADAITIQSVVPRNATFESLLRQQQLAPELALSVVDAVRGVFNPRQLRADQDYWVIRTLDGLFREFRYQINPDELLRVVFETDNDTAHSATPNFNVEVVKIPKEYERLAVSAHITAEANSLYAAFQAEGQSVLLPHQLAEVFSGEVDFNSELQRGDRFDVLVDRVIRNGEYGAYGDIQAAVMETGSRRLTAYRFVGPDDKVGWYDEEGRSLRRAFLKTPLPFDPRITSGFSMNRFHPVHGRRRPHLGVDYGAPTGTRVMAVAGGVITTAAWSGEAGRLVRIKHSGGYETMYLHLSGFGPGIRKGTRVDQGQLIGYVGMTGTATGPHLDYRVVRNGTYMNPVTAFRGMPAGEPIAPEQMDAFTLQRDQSNIQLTGGLREPVAAAD